MVKVEVEVEEVEARALNELMKDAKTPIQMGFILEVFRRKLAKAFNDKMQNNILDEAEKILVKKEASKPKTKVKKDEKSEGTDN